MGHYGTQTRLKYILPYTKYKPCYQNIRLSSKAKMRLKWMDYINSGKTVAACARHFDHPHSTIKFWYNRFNPKDLSSLEDKSSTPKRKRKLQLTEHQEHLIYWVRTYELVGVGKVALQKYIEKEYGVRLGQQAIQKVINKSGLKREKKSRNNENKQRQKRKHMYAVPDKYKKEPGGLVYLDVKHLRKGKEKWYQFTALDHASRLVGAKIYRRITAESSKSFFKYLDERYPFEQISYVGTDNGSEFLGVFEEELERRGIEHVFSSPASPKQNPYVERVIRTIVEGQYKIFGLEDSLELQQEALEEYCYKYNHKRPHQSLGYKTPMEIFVKLSSDNSFT